MHSKLKLCALSLGISCLGIAAAQGQGVLYHQDWSGFANGESVYGDDYYLQRGTPPTGNPAANNSAIVHHNQYGNYLSLLSYAHVGDNYAPLVRTVADHGFFPLSIPNLGGTITVSMDMRYQSPGVVLNRGGSSPYSSARVYTEGVGSDLWFGFFGTNQVFFGAGANSVVVDNFVATNWYRFVIDINQQDGSRLLSVFEVDESGDASTLVASIGDGAGGTGTYTAITGYRFELVRPGTNQAAVNNGQVWSADFANVSFAVVPEPGTVAAILSGSALALALGVRTWRRRR